MGEKFPHLMSTTILKQEFMHLERIDITCNEFSIGRGLDNNVNISFLALSRKHCIFKQTEEDQWTLEDLSTFGIKLNGKSMTKGSAHSLRSNDVIQLDVCGEFEYKFVTQEEGPPKKLRKIAISSDTVCEKFAESQNYEIQLMENKIQNTQKLQHVSLARKEWLNLELQRNVQRLEDEYSLQIENLKGEKKEIEMQKFQLEQQRDAQIASMKQEMDNKLSELMEKINGHYTKEAALLRENSILKERLMRERDEFLLKLNKENASKQDLLLELEEKIRKQEVVRIQEKQLLENALRQEAEKLRIAKEKELKDLEEKKKLREKELELALEDMKTLLKNQLEQTKLKQIEAEQQLHRKTEEINEIKEHDKTMMAELDKARENAEKKLAEAQIRAIKSEEELQKKMKEREIELASLAADRIQLQAEQSNQVIYNLQKQLEEMRSQLQTLEGKNYTTEIVECIDVGETSKESTLAEVGALMESELQCSVCAELLVRPVTLGCSHTFCHYCITRWRQKSKNCPNCRVTIKSEAKSLAIETFIEKMVNNLSDDMKKKREEMLKEREELEAELARENTGDPPSRGNRNATTSEPNRNRDELYAELLFWAQAQDVQTESNEESSGNSNTSDRSDSDSSLDSSSVEEEEDSDDVMGVSGAYYGGYGRCFRCGARGHWAPGCPRN